jgi:Cysteine-rich CPCC/Clp amino terminal domain, pathogenicity island component
LGERLAEFDLLFSFAAEEARARDHHWLGPEHFILAILGRPEDSAAAQALRASGVTYDAFSAEYERRLDRADRPERKSSGIGSTPAYHEIIGFAKGLAAGLGSEQVTGEHVLLAVLWEPETGGADLLETIGAEREDVLARLVELRVDVPRQPLPRRRERRRYGERFYVPLDQLEAIRAELAAYLPISWNVEEGRGWVSGPEGVDLSDYIPFALEAWERGRLPCPSCRCVTLPLEVPLGERVCDVCRWIDDPVQRNNPDYAGGANPVSLTRARENFSRLGASDEQFRDVVRPPRSDEIPPWFDAPVAGS